MTTIINTKTGDVLANNISPVWAGVIGNCSMVPVSFSLTASAEATSEAFMNMMIRLRELDTPTALGRTVVAHLGNGASMCALHAGKSVATTMSFTPIDGLPMGTRCGAVDPGVLLYLMKKGSDLPTLEKLLYNESGLLGVSGISSDVRTLLASSETSAAEALDLFLYRCGRELGSLAASICTALRLFPHCFPTWKGGFPTRNSELKVITESKLSRKCGQAPALSTPKD